ncbi:uncharacterized protein F5891DRAFT_987746 [Suillus fuscotomentosus]|uniref:Uncharacterized protein n=1 Tax=Suillus fuscotomentosus TaxID=1912939 RepID=A0AAD4DPR6_9AGAM|nr:uncharacterized protein F5891DRAFT_987746 [Suillus fuscotomentosus]KAG1888904.1 hypothetical protein F5891DRAFT_987746 [Suillus fuscotomentosus]
MIVWMAEHAFDLMSPVVEKRSRMFVWHRMGGKVGTKEGIRIFCKHHEEERTKRIFYIWQTWSESAAPQMIPATLLSQLPHDVQSTPAATADIQLAYQSLLAIVATLHTNGSGIDSDSAGSEKYHLVSSWKRVVPWLVFFHDQFIMCRANYRPVDKMAAIRLVASLLFHVSVIESDSTEISVLSTPVLYCPIAELWLLAVNTKDRDVVCLSSRAGARTTSFRIFGTFVIAECICDKSFLTILAEVSGGVDAVASAALKYVKNIRSMAKNPDIASDAFKLKLVVSMFSCCVAIILSTSMHDAAMREAYILRQSLKEVFSTLRVLQSLPPGRGSMTGALRSTIPYIRLLLENADDPVSVFHQALRAHAVETMIHISPSEHLSVDIVGPGKPHMANEAFLRILTDYTLHDKILSYVSEHVDTWSDDLGPIMRQDKPLWDVWSELEQKIRSYGILRSRAEMIVWPSLTSFLLIRRLRTTSVTAVVLRKTFVSGNVRDVRLYGTAQSDASVIPGIVTIGSSIPHHVKRSLRLLAALEVGHKQRKWDNILRLVVAARYEYPEDRERLVVELALDKNEELVRPLRNYLFLFDGLSENEVVDRLSSWPDSRGQLQGLFLCSVITIHDRYAARQILFSPCIALDMEIVPQTFNGNVQDV